MRVVNAPLTLLRVFTHGRAKGLIHSLDMQPFGCLYFERGRSVQGARRSQPATVAGPAAPGEWPDPGRAVPTPGHDAPGGEQASGAAGGGQPRGHGAARAREAALPQPGADPRDQRALDREVRTPPPAGAGCAQERIGGGGAMTKPNFVYVTYIRT